MTPKKYKKDYKEVINGLHYAWAELRKHPKKNTAGNDNVSINIYSGDYPDRLLTLRQKLLENKFTFSPLKRKIVDKGREILIYTIDERILKIALLKVVFERLKHLNSNHDYSRKGFYVNDDEEESEEPDFEGTPLAVEKIQEYLREGYIWVLEADIKSFFDNISKEKIFKLVKKHIHNKEILDLIKQIIYFKVEKSSDQNAKIHLSDKGIAQGSSLSPLLASIYLYKFDTYVMSLPDVKLVRYVDDFIILCKDKETATKTYHLVKQKLLDMDVEIYALGEKHKKTGLEKTRIILTKGTGSESFDFLGLSFNYTDVDISKKKKDEIDTKLKQIIHGGSDNFLKKTRSVESRLNGYIDHYKKPHYSRTIASLVKIINFAESELRRCYFNSHKRIIGSYPFEKSDKTTIDKFFKFIGINFTALIQKVKTVKSSRHFTKGGIKRKPSSSK